MKHCPICAEPRGELDNPDLLIGAYRNLHREAHLLWRNIARAIFRRPTVCCTDHYPTCSAWHHCCNSCPYQEHAP